MARPKIMMTDTAYPDTLVEMIELQKINAEIVRPRDLSAAALIEAGHDCVGVMCDYANMTAEVLDGLKQCKVISEAGMGVDNIDLQAAAKRGIKVANVPHYCVGEVADHAMALFLACAKNIPLYNKDVKSGKWDCTAYSPMYRIAGQNFCCFGFGQIARKVAERAKAFEMHVFAYDPFLPDTIFEKLGVERLHSLEELAAKADVLSLHVPPTPETKGIINRDIFNLMKPTAILVNVARGALVNNVDLAEALRNGKIRAAGLDVQEQEPPTADCPLLGLENTVLTPHSAFNTVQAEDELRRTQAAEIVRTLTEGEPVSWVNKALF